MREVKVTVHPDGTTSSDFSGFAGPSCLDEAERLRQILASLGIGASKPALPRSQSSHSKRARECREDKPHEYSVHHCLA